MKGKLRYQNIIKSNFTEYLYYLILVSLAITFVMGGALYSYFSSVMRRETIETNNNILEQLKNAQEVVLTEVDNSMANIVIDPLFSTYDEYYKTKDIVAVKTIMDKLDGITISNKYIDSVYIYYCKDNFVLSTNSSYTPEEDFYDKDFVRQLMDKNISGSLLENRKMPKYGENASVEVLSFVKSIPLIYYGKPTAIVVLNMKTQYLQKTVEQINIKKGSSVVIANEEGDIISQKMEASAFNDADMRKYVNLKDNSSAGYTIGEVNGHKTLVSYVSSEAFKLKFIYTIPMSAITSNIQFVGFVTLLLCIAISILSIISSFFISKRFYSPIQSMLALFGRNNPGKENGREISIKETVLIEQNISSLIDKANNLEVLLKDYEIYQKTRFLQSLVEGEFEGDRKVHEKLSYYGIDFDRNGYFVCFVLSLDNYAQVLKEYSEKQQNMLFIYISENITQEVFDKYKGFIVDVSTNEIAVIVNFDETDNPAELMNISRNLAKQIHAFITEGMKYTFTLGVSTLRQGVGQIQECYREGASAVNYRLLLGYDNVIFFDSMEERSQSKASYPFFIEKDILNNLKVGDEDGVSNAMEEFTGYIYNNLTDDIELVRHYFLQLLSSSVKCIYEMDRNLETVSASYKDIYTAILREETMKGMAATVKKLYEAVLKSSVEKRSMKNKELTDSVARYIKENVGGDLSIESLSAKYYISSSYLRKIFKDEMGVTVKEYTNNLRMERAKELLSNPNIKISDVSEKVGYLTVQAFTYAFKLDTGKTPGEYRTECLSRE